MLEVTQRVEGRDKNQSFLTLPQDSRPTCHPANPGPSPPSSPPLIIPATLGLSSAFLSDGGCGHSVFKLPFEGRAEEGPGEGASTQHAGQGAQTRLSEMGSVWGVFLCKHLRHN